MNDLSPDTARQLLLDLDDATPDDPDEAPVVLSSLPQNRRAPDGTWTTLAPGSLAAGQPRYITAAELAQIDGYASAAATFARWASPEGDAARAAHQAMLDRIHDQIVRDRAAAAPAGGQPAGSSAVA